MDAEIEKSRVIVLGPGWTVLNSHTNARWVAPEFTGAPYSSQPIHGLNIRRNLYGVALASNADTRELEIWVWLIASRNDMGELDAERMRMWGRGAWFIGTHTPALWDKMTTYKKGL